MNDKTADSSTLPTLPIGTPDTPTAIEPVFVPAPAHDPAMTASAVSPVVEAPGESASSGAGTSTVHSHQDANEIEETQEMKMAMLDSAELATRAASLAANAGNEINQATHKLIATFATQQKLAKIILAAAGGLMLLTTVVFVGMSTSLLSRLGKLDAMMLAVGKRVVSMDASLELVGAASEQLKDVLEKQDAISGAQSKLESRLDDVMKTSQGAAEQSAKQADAKSQDTVKLIQGLDTRLQAQASAVKSVSAQIQRLQAAVPDTGGLRRDLEALAKQQRDRQAQETTVKAAAPAPAKPRDQVVQYPRTTVQGSPTDKP